jgi:hypothetical protein
MFLSLIATVTKRLGVLCLVSVIAWHLFQHSATQLGKAVVYLPRPDVAVSVDNHYYPAESNDGGQVVCILQPGAHVLRVWRGQLLLREQSITIEAGKDLDVRPFDHSKTPSNRGWNEPLQTSQTSDPASLLVHSRPPG